MIRTNIYLGERQLDVLREIGGARNRPVAELVREAVDAWLSTQGVKVIGEDEWQQRFDSLMSRRAIVAGASGFSEKAVVSDVNRAVRQVRRARAARRH